MPYPLVGDGDRERAAGRAAPRVGDSFEMIDGRRAHGERRRELRRRHAEGVGRERAVQSKDKGAVATHLIEVQLGREPTGDHGPGHG